MSLKSNDILLFSMIIIDIYLCYYIFEPLVGKLDGSSDKTISSCVEKINTELLLGGILTLNFLSFIYELNIKNSIFTILFISLINMCVTGSVLFKYNIFPEEHLFFAIILFINVLLYMVYSSCRYNYKLVYIQLILSGYCIYYYLTSPWKLINDDDNNGDEIDNKIGDEIDNKIDNKIDNNENNIFIIEILLLLNFALFYLTRHFYIR